MDNQWEQQRDAFHKCSRLIFDLLDITAILPCLISEGLTTDNDLDVLRNEFRTKSDKILHLIYVLPRKPNFFEKFLNCLYQSADGAAHAEIARKLEQLIDYSY